MHALIVRSVNHSLELRQTDPIFLSSFKKSLIVCLNKINRIENKFSETSAFINLSEPSPPFSLLFLCWNLSLNHARLPLDFEPRLPRVLQLLAIAPWRPLHGRTVAVDDDLAWVDHVWIRAIASFRSYWDRAHAQGSEGTWALTHELQEGNDHPRVQVPRRCDRGCRLACVARQLWRVGDRAQSNWNQ